MSFKVAKELLNKFKNVYSLCKSIETVTILTLHMFKNKITGSKLLVQFFFCYLKEYYSTNVSLFIHLIVPFFTDKSCSGIINNLL